MKLGADLEKAFNDQIVLEFEASMVYRQLAIELAMRDLPGMAQWMRARADEELVHAHKFIDHLVDRGNHPVVGDMKVARPAVESVSDAFTAALQHERLVSESIRNLYRACEAAGELDSRPMLNWFLEEQIEEEATVTEILGRLDLIGDDGPGLIRLDAELKESALAVPVG